MFSLFCSLHLTTPSPSTDRASKEIKKSLSARDAGSLTSRINDSVNGTDFLYNYNYIYIFQAVRRAVNVIKLMFLRVSKYPPNAIFRNANINSQRAKVTDSMIWHTNPRPPM